LLTANTHYSSATGRSLLQLLVIDAFSTFSLIVLVMKRVLVKEIFLLQFKVT